MPDMASPADRLAPYQERRALLKPRYPSWIARIMDAHLADVAARHPDRPLILTDELTLSYADVVERPERTTVGRPLDPGAAGIDIGMGPEEIRNIASGIPLRRRSEAVDIAWSVVFLSSDRARQLTDLRPSHEQGALRPARPHLCRAGRALVGVHQARSRGRRRRAPPHPRIVRARAPEARRGANGGARWRAAGFERAREPGCPRPAGARSRRLASRRRTS